MPRDVDGRNKSGHDDGEAESVSREGPNPHRKSKPDSNGTSPGMTVGESASEVQGAATVSLMGAEHASKT